MTFDDWWGYMNFECGLRIKETARLAYIAGQQDTIDEMDHWTGSFLYNPLHGGG